VAKPKKKPAMTPTARKRKTTTSQDQKILLEFDADDVDLLIESIDSHRYWQLSDPQFRNSGFVHGKGSNDPDSRRELRRCSRVERVLERARRVARNAVGAKGV
jgi:hypothetical protein